MQMQGKTYQVTLTGIAPLLLHHDNVPWSEKMKEWQMDPATRKESVAGDDRTPAWRWIGCVYSNLIGGKQILSIPSDNIMSVLREGGKQCPTGRGRQTYAKQTQSGIRMIGMGWPLMVGGQVINYSEFESLIGEKDFSKHEQFAIDRGFELFIKRVRIGTSKWIRVRPMFPPNVIGETEADSNFSGWSTTGKLLVTDETITKDVLATILKFAGTYAGLGDWRPSAKTPGGYGLFVPTVEELA